MSGWVFRLASGGVDEPCNSAAAAPQIDLRAGDVISYSAGSTQGGLLNYRKLRPRPGLFGAAVARWPELGEGLDGRTPMLINAYPAALGAMNAGITVDTYVSPRIVSRALELSARAQNPAVLCAQPLFMADALLKHVVAERPLPDTVLLFMGGYVTPRLSNVMLETRPRGWAGSRAGRHRVRTRPRARKTHTGPTEFTSAAAKPACSTGASTH